MEAAEPGSWPGGGVTRWMPATSRPQVALLGPGLALPLVIPSKSSGKDAAGGLACVHPPVPATGPARERPPWTAAAGS